MNLIFLSIFLVVPFIVLAAVKLPNNRWLSLLKINNAWHTIDQASEQIIKPYQSHYTLKQYMVLWIMTSTAAYVITWFAILFSWIGIFSDNPSWASSHVITDLIQMHIEISFFAFLVAIMGRFHEVSPTNAFKKTILKQNIHTDKKAPRKIKAQQYFTNYYLKTMAIAFLFNWGLLQLYALIIDRFILFEGAHNFVLLP